MAAKVQFFVLQISCNVYIPLRGQCLIGHSRHRADEYGVFLMNFALSYGYFQSALGWLHSILLAHFWYVCIMFSSILDSVGQKYSLEILSTFTVLLLISFWHFLRHMFDVLAFQLFYEQDCRRSILRWGGLYFRLFISSKKKCVWSPFEFV